MISRVTVSKAFRATYAWLLVVVFAMSCGETEPTPIDYVFPQQLGVKWTYLKAHVVEIGEHTVPEPSTFTFRSLRDTTMSRMRWIRIDSLTMMMSNCCLGDEPFWIGQNDRAVFHTRRPWITTPPTDSVLLWFPHPVLKGQTGLDGYGDQFVVSAVDTVVQTPAGNFNSVRYDFLAKQETYFVSPGIGIVRKLFVSDRAKDSEGNYIYLVRGIISLTAVEGITP